MQFGVRPVVTVAGLAAELEKVDLKWGMGITFTLD